MKTARARIQPPKTVLSYDHIALIYNPNSTGNAASLARRLSKKLTALTDVTVALMPTKAPGHGRKIAYQITKSYKHPLIISVSGDGGYHDVVNGCLGALADGSESLPVCAVEAAGNANDHYAYQRGKDTLLQGIKKGHTKPMEVLRVEVKSTKRPPQVIYAHSYWGIGLTSKAIDTLNQTKLNPVKEKVIVAKELINHKAVNLRIKNKKEVVNNIIVSLVPRMAKMIKIQQSQAHKPRGTFWLLIDRQHTKTAILKHIVKGALKNLKDESRQEKSFTCTILEAWPMQLDGEVYRLHKGDCITVTVEKNALKTL